MINVGAYGCIGKRIVIDKVAFAIGVEIVYHRCCLCGNGGLH